MRTWICKLLLKWWGFKIVGSYPEIDKFIIAVVPHTSWKDFFLGIFVRGALNKPIQFVGKKALFFFPLGILMKWLGGVPVDRRKNNNFVDAVVEAYNSNDKLAIALAPEGTRRKVDKLKTGFYYIAKKANVPIQPVVFNVKEKKVEFPKLFYPTNDVEADLSYFDTVFGGYKGFKPELSYL